MGVPELTPEAIMELAEAAALFLRRLVDEGVAIESATSLTASFISAHILKATIPTEPWEAK